MCESMSKQMHKQFPLKKLLFMDKYYIIIEVFKRGIFIKALDNILLLNLHNFFLM